MVVSKIGFIFVVSNNNNLKNSIMYNDNNIKKLVKLLTKRNRPIENLICRGAKLGIEEQEVVNSMDLLLDLGVVTTEVIETGDGWNTRDKVERFLLVNQA